MGEIFEEGEDQYIREFTEELVEETAREIRAYKSQIKRMYIHMIKYEVCKNDQDSDWVRSITDVIGELDGISTNNMNKIVNELDDIYADARKAARDELKSKGYKYFTDICPKDLPEEYILSRIMDKKYMDKWLEDRAYSEMVRKRLHMNTKLTPQEQKIVNNPKYTITDAFPDLAR